MATLIITLILFVSFAAHLLGQRSQKNVETAQNKPQIGMLFEACLELNGSLPDSVQFQLNKTSVASIIWRTPCDNFLSFASTLTSAMSSGILGLMVVARRHYLDLAYSATFNTSVKTAFIGSANTLDLVVSQVYTTNETEYSVNGRQFWQMMAEIVNKIISNWNWRNIYMYSDEIIDVGGKKILQNSLQEFWLSTSIKLLQNPKSADPGRFLDQMLYDEIGFIEAKQMVIVCNEEVNAEIARQASARNLFTERYQWLFFSLDSKNIYQEIKLRFDSQVVIMHPTPWTVGVTFGKIQNFFNYVLESVMDLKNKIPINNQPIAIDTGRGPKQHQNNANQEEQTLTSKQQPLSMDIVKLQVRRRRQRPELIKVGHWTIEDGVAVSPYDVLSNFDGINIPISTIDSAPYVITTVDINGLESYSGYLIDLLQLLAKILNFKYTLTRIPDNSFGNCINSSSCDGLIGALVRKEVEIGLANFISSVSKLDYIDFSSHAVDQGGVSILISRPQKTDAMAIWAYFRPFAWPVAVLVGASYIIFALLLHLTMEIYFQLKLSNSNIEKSLKAQIADTGGLSRCTVMSIQGFSQQGIDVVPQNPSSKVVYAVMWVFSVFMMSAYNSNLISYFTVTDVDWPFQTLQELLQKDDYGIVMIKGTTYLSDFQTDKESILYKVYERLAKEKFRLMVDDLDTALERVRKGPMALLHSKRILEFVESRTCNFTVLDALYLSSPISIAFQKDSQFTKPISTALLRLEESGLTENLKARWWPPVSDCDDYNTGYKSVSVWAITSLLAILAAGIMTSTAFLLVEQLMFKKRAQIRALSAQLRQAINTSSARLFNNNNDEVKRRKSRTTVDYRRSRTPRYVKRFLMFTTEDAIKTLNNNYRKD